MPLIRRLSVTHIHILVCNAYIWAFFVRIYMRVYKKMVVCLGIKTHKAGKNASIRGRKTQVCRVAEMIASIRGKKPHVYRGIILKQKLYTQPILFYLRFT